MKAILIDSAVRRWLENKNPHRSRHRATVFVFDRDGTQYKIFNNCYHEVQSESGSTWSVRPTQLRSRDIVRIVAQWDREKMTWLSPDELMKSVHPDETRCNLAAIASTAVEVADDRGTSDDAKSAARVLASVTATLLKNEALSSDGGELTLSELMNSIGEYVMSIVAHARV